MTTPNPQRRTGDTIAISGDYQFEAARSRNPVQRFWHHAKQTAISALCPPTPGERVLDVGCGSGVISHYLSSSCEARVTGVDGNRDAVAFAGRQFPGIEFHHGLVDEAFLPKRQFDRIYCLEVIEHIHDHQVDALLAHFHRLLRPGGRLFVTTPNYRSLWPSIEWLMDRLGLAPRLVGDQHVNFFHAARLRAQIEKAGFSIDLLRTNCFLAPWVAPLSWRLASALDRWERATRHPIGSILVAVATRTP